MKAIFVPICLGFAVFFGLPMANEGSINPCGAYDALAVRIGAPIVGNKGQQQNELLNGKKFGDLLNGAMNGQPQAIKIAPPAQPGDTMIGLSCTTKYWKAMTGIGWAS
jgi:hypothetical protein